MSEHAAVLPEQGMEIDAGGSSGGCSSVPEDAPNAPAATTPAGATAALPCGTAAQESAPAEPAKEASGSGAQLETAKFTVRGTDTVITRHPSGNFKVDCARESVRVSVLKHTGVNGENPSQPGYFYWQAYGNRTGHKWCGWETIAGAMLKTVRTCLKMEDVCIVCDETGESFSDRDAGYAMIDAKFPKRSSAPVSKNKSKYSPKNSPRARGSRSGSVDNADMIPLARRRSRRESASVIRERKKEEEAKAAAQVSTQTTSGTDAQHAVPTQNHTVEQRPAMVKRTSSSELVNTSPFLDADDRNALTNILESLQQIPECARLFESDTTHSLLPLLHQMQNGEIESVPQFAIEVRRVVHKVNATVPASHPLASAAEAVHALFEKEFESFASFDVVSLGSLLSDAYLFRTVNAPAGGASAVATVFPDEGTPRTPSHAAYVLKIRQRNAHDAQRVEAMLNTYVRRWKHDAFAYERVDGALMGLLANHPHLAVVLYDVFRAIDERHPLLASNLRVASCMLRHGPLDWVHHMPRRSEERVSGEDGELAAVVASVTEGRASIASRRRERRASFSGIPPIDLRLLDVMDSEDLRLQRTGSLSPHQYGRSPYDMEIEVDGFTGDADDDQEFDDGDHDVEDTRIVNACKRAVEEERMVQGFLCDNEMVETSLTGHTCT